MLQKKDKKIEYIEIGLVVYKYALVYALWKLSLLKYCRMGWYLLVTYYKYYAV